MAHTRIATTVCNELQPLYVTHRTNVQSGHKQWLHTSTAEANGTKQMSTPPALSRYSSPPPPPASPAHCQTGVTPIQSPNSFQSDTPHSQTPPPQAHTSSTASATAARPTCVHEWVASESLPPCLECVLVQPPGHCPQVSQHGALSDEGEVEGKVPARTAIKICKVETKGEIYKRVCAQGQGVCVVHQKEG